MAVTRSGSKRLLRDLNRHIVLQLIAEHGPLSRTVLARRSKLPASTITYIVGDFVASGVVTEKAVRRPGAGRTPVLVDLDPSVGYLVGIKLGDDDVTVVVCDLRCDVVHTLQAEVPPDVDPQGTVAFLATAVERAITESGVPRNAVLGVGAGIPGIVDSGRRKLTYSHIRGWRDVEIAGELENALGVPVWIDNVVNTLAIGERRFGAGRGVQDLLLVTIGRGIGLGTVIGGNLHRGIHGAASDFGHTTVDPSPFAPYCNCGKRGCLEAVASDYGIVRAVLGSDPGPRVETQIESIVDQARSGDERLLGLFSHAGETLGIAIANLINLFDPALVLLAGEGLRAQDLFLPQLRSAIALHAPAHRPEETRVELLNIDDRAWARGAAGLVLHELLRPPIMEASRPLLIDRLSAAPSVSRLADQNDETVFEPVGAARA